MKNYIFYRINLSHKAVLGLWLYLGGGGVGGGRGEDEEAEEKAGGTAERRMLPWKEGRVMESGR